MTLSLYEENRPPVAAMSVGEARGCVERIKQHMDGARRELLALYEGQGWSALGYANWRECVVAEFEQSQAYLYRQLQAAEIERRVSPIGEIGAIPESHLRPMSAIEPEQQAEVWQRVQETAPEGRVTAAHVESVVDEFRPPPVEPPPAAETTSLLTRVQGAPKSRDDFQTPTRWLAPLLPHLKPDWVVWECAEGKGNLSGELRAKGRRVIGSDLLSGQDFLTWEPEGWDCIVTNPPYSEKDGFLARCYALGKPFALLMPIAALGEQGRMALYRQHGIQIVLPPERINFETPSGEGSGAWFFSVWFLGFFDLPRDLNFWEGEK